MQEFINELKEKVGLTEEQATKAVEVLFEKIKSKVPESLHDLMGSFFADAKKEGGSIVDKMQNMAKKIKDEL